MKFTAVTSSILLVLGLTPILSGEVTDKKVEEVLSASEVKMKRVKEALDMTEKQYQEVLKKREENLKKFSNLHPGDRKKFRQLMTKARGLMGRGEAMEAFYFFGEAERIFSHSLDLKSGLSAVYLETRKFDDAKKVGKDLLAVDPFSGVYRYNLAEAFYASKEYPKAYEHFILLEKLQQALEIKETRLTQAVQFKIMLCLVGMNKSSKLTLAERENALELYKKRYAENSKRAVTKLYFYTKALEYFRLGEKKEATKWIVNANTVFPRRSEHTLWVDAFIEFGYINSYYGGAENKPEDSILK